MGIIVLEHETLTLQANATRDITVLAVKALEPPVNIYVLLVIIALVVPLLHAHAGMVHIKT